MPKPFLESLPPSMQDAETQVFEIELQPQHPAGPAELESVPLIAKSSIESSLWTQEQCARRIGLTIDEAATVLSFLRTLRQGTDATALLDSAGKREIWRQIDSFVEFLMNLIAFQRLYLLLWKGSNGGS